MGAGQDLNAIANKQAIAGSVRIALVKGMDPNALFGHTMDFEEACRVCEAETEMMPEP